MGFGHATDYRVDGEAVEHAAHAQIADEHAGVDRKEDEQAWQHQGEPPCTSAVLRRALPAAHDLLCDLHRPAHVVPPALQAAGGEGLRRRLPEFLEAGPLEGDRNKLHTQAPRGTGVVPVILGGFASAPVNLIAARLVPATTGRAANVWPHIQVATVAAATAANPATRSGAASTKFRFLSCKVLCCEQDCRHAPSGWERSLTTA
mmetsp:Transcript_129382/g.374678  ORF Transcript_129382/g.374678 Transcript_129382/m.374678 type:complete len:204 (-) Transcript_129382:8-619(-)